jgi:hypothetical protein
MMPDSRVLGVVSMYRHTGALLRAHAFADGMTLADVADEVVTRRLDFRDPGR